MAIPYKNIIDFLKIDFGLTFKNSLLLTALYLFVIPIIRGISNLDRIQSAQCMVQSVAFVGVILIVPITKRELEINVREVIDTKPWPYIQSIFIRLFCSWIVVIAVILGFAFVMKMKNCEFPYWEFSFATILYTNFLGLFGLVLSQLGNNVMVGYLSALGYWSFCQFQLICEGELLYFFPVTKGSIELYKVVLLIFILVILLGILTSVIKHRNDKL